MPGQSEEPCTHERVYLDCSPSSIANRLHSRLNRLIACFNNCLDQGRYEEGRADVRSRDGMQVKLSKAEQLERT